MQNLQRSFDKFSGTWLSLKGARFASFCSLYPQNTTQKLFCGSFKWGSCFQSSPGPKRSLASKSRVYDSGFDSGDWDDALDAEYLKAVISGEDPAYLTGNLDEEDLGNIKVHCFWDLDNKQIESKKEIAPTVEHIRNALEHFGSVASIQAFGNAHCFSYVPLKEREDRKEWKANRQSGEVRCDVCGGRFANHEKLKKHFKMHEKEFNKRMARRNSKKKKNRMHLNETYFHNKEKMDKYYGTRDKVFLPRKGFGLQKELKASEVQVVQTPNKKESADEALNTELNKLLAKSKQEKVAVCIISDDKGFTEAFQKCKKQDVVNRIAVTSSAGCFGPHADHYLDWEAVKFGLFDKPDFQHGTSNSQVTDSIRIVDVS